MNKFRMMSVLVTLAMLFGFANFSPSAAALTGPTLVHLYEFNGNMDDSVVVNNTLNINN